MSDNEDSHYPAVRRRFNQILHNLQVNEFLINYVYPTVKEKASGIYFSLTEATLYPFTEEGKAYEFSANKVYTVKDEVKNVAAFGDKIEVVLSYTVSGLPRNSREADNTNTKSVSEGTTVKVFRKTPDSIGNDYQGRLINLIELWNKKIDLYKAEDAEGQIEYFRLNAEKVFYGDEIPEPSVKPIFAKYFYKGMKDEYKSTETKAVYYDKDTTRYYTLGSIDVEGTKDTAGYAIPVPTVTKYDGKLYFVA